jgi:putative photosynthetic complex assembly protein
MASSNHILSQKPFAIIAVGLALTVMVTGAARLSGFTPPASLPQQQPEAVILLKFEDADQGTVVVRNANSHDVIQSFGVGEGAFLRATLRALVNDRRKQGNTNQGDFRLERHASGQHYLIDEATGRSISLNAFGPDNSAVFAAFMSNQQKGEGL